MFKLDQILTDLSKIKFLIPEEPKLHNKLEWFMNKFLYIWVGLFIILTILIFFLAFFNFNLGSWYINIAWTTFAIAYSFLVLYAILYIIYSVLSISYSYKNNHIYLINEVEYYEVKAKKFLKYKITEIKYALDYLKNKIVAMTSKIKIFFSIFSIIPTSSVFIFVSKNLSFPSLLENPKLFISSIKGINFIPTLLFCSVLLGFFIGVVLAHQLTLKLKKQVRVLEFALTLKEYSPITKIKLPNKR